MLEIFKVILSKIMDCVTPFNRPKPSLMKYRLVNSYRRRYDIRNQVSNIAKNAIFIEYFYSIVLGH